MRWARFDQNGTATYGIVEGDSIQPVSGTPFGEWKKSGAAVSVSDVKLLIPFEPVTFYACGLNYAEHVREVAAKIGAPTVLPPNPDVGYRANNSLVAHNEAIVIPKDATEKVQYEGELVVVIGKKAKHLIRENALDCVLGYTIGNDVSERSWQKSDRTLWRAKNTDSFAPMGSVDRNRGRPAQAGHQDPDERQGADPVPYQRNDLRRGGFSGGYDAVCHAGARRYDLDGDRGRHREHEAWRCLRGGDRWDWDFI